MDRSGKAHLSEERTTVIACSILGGQVSGEVSNVDHILTWQKNAHAWGRQGGNAGGPDA